MPALFLLSILCCCFLASISFAPKSVCRRAQQPRTTALTKKGVTLWDGITASNELDEQVVRKALDKDIANVAFPAFISLFADPLASFVDAVYVGQLGAVQQAGMGIATSAQYSIAKLYNDPLLKTSTSLVAGKSGDELSASVTTAIATAIIIGICQCLVFILFASPILTAMGVAAASDMKAPALSYLKWRALGIPAATILLVSNGIFRGRGDTKTPMYCAIIGSIVNIVLDPFLIFTLGMGCAGAGAATAVSQWVTAIPLLYQLNKAVPLRLSVISSNTYVKKALVEYFKAGSLILFRTVAKIAAYTVTASAAARLGTVPMAAYALTFNLGFVTSQLCEAFSIAAQSLIAREMPLNSEVKKLKASHVIFRALSLGIIVSGSLAISTHLNLEGILSKMSTSPEVRSAAATIMPIVLLTQLFKGLSYATGGILMGGLDWLWSTIGMTAASIVCVSLVSILPPSLWNIWVALAAFMGTQVIFSSSRIFSGTGPWTGLRLLKGLQIFKR